MIDWQSLLMMRWINPAALRVSGVESRCSVDSLITGTVPGIDLVVRGSGCIEGTAKQSYSVIFCSGFGAGSHFPLQ